MSLGQLGQTITVVNKSGKVVSTSKQLVNVWKEAKAAYRERKAELQVTRAADIEEKRARKALKHVTIEDDNASRTSSRASRSRPHRAKSHRHVDRPALERGYTDSFYANDNGDIEERRRHHRAKTSFEQDLASPEAHTRELTRRHTDGEQLTSDQHQRRHSAPQSRNSIDMDLAYGEFHALPPPSPARMHTEELEVREKMTKLTMLLEEANCIQYSVTSMVEHLQKNPDALAAVALTLAEISNLASKMAPGALMAMKSSFPAIIALLASPQFLIAAGVGVGVTVVMLGGYKIIKRIKDKTVIEEEASQPLEMQEIDTDLSRIEQWRRGIADAHDDSAGTSVDGEFITPNASKRLIADGLMKPEDIKPSKSRSGKKKSKSEAKHRHSSRDDSSSKAGSEKKEKTGGKRQKAAGGLKMLFKPHSTLA